MELFAQLERQNGLPPGLLDAVWSAESNRGQNMVSPKGAEGHFQFMPATAAQYGVTNPNDLQQAATGAAKMLSDMMQQTGSLPGALAAYNWGIGNVQRKGLDSAPAETRNYIQKVTANMPQQNDPWADLASKYTQGAPQQAANDDGWSALAKQYVMPPTPEPAPQQVAQAAPQPQQQPQSFGSELAQGAGNLLAGGIRGAGSIGATLLAPYDVVKDLVAGKGITLQSNRERRAGIDSGLQELGAQPDSMLYKGGKLAGEIAGTAGAGGAIAQGARMIPGVANAAAPLLSAIESGGMSVGGLTGIPALATRAAGGAITGAASAGLVNPEDAKTGAMVGGAFPVAASAIGNGMRSVGRAITGGGVTPEVAALADKAQQYGISIPADRIVNSKPMNALAASLEYMPLSGRSATLDNMQNQLNRALSRTFGQDSDNVTMALRKAQSDLGGQFDNVLKNNTVNVDPQFMDDLATKAQQATNELESGQAKVILNQIDEIMQKAPNDQIDGQAAYNIKKTLDRIGQGNTPQAWYANDLKKSLMGALNRSLSPEDAAAFATTRQQYGTMLDLKKLAQNGADGDISIARLANMKNIGNPQLQDLADISAQFLKPRESAHGAMQRVVLGGLGAAGAGTGAVSPLLLGAGIAAGRGTNKALNSQALRNIMLGQPVPGGGLLTNTADAAAKVLPLLVPAAVNGQ